MRDAPSVEEGVVQYVAYAGDELEVTGEQSEHEGIVWMRLVDGNWVQGQYLEFAADLTKETTPILAIVLPEIGLNVRTAPNTVDSTISYVAAEGSKLVLTGHTVEAEGVTWYKIEDGNWAQGQYLEIGQ